MLEPRPFIISKMSLKPCAKETHSENKSIPNLSQMLKLDINDTQFRLYSLTVSQGKARFCSGVCGNAQVFHILACAKFLPGYAKFEVVLIRINKINMEKHYNSVIKWKIDMYIVKPWISFYILHINMYHRVPFLLALFLFPTFRKGRWFLQALIRNTQRQFRMFHIIKEIEWVIFLIMFQNSLRISVSKKPICRSWEVWLHIGC